METSLLQGSTVRFSVYQISWKKMCKYRLITHPLFVQFEELFGDFGCAERQSQTGDVKLGDDLLQNLLERQTPHRAVPSRRGHRVL